MPPVQAIFFDIGDTLVFDTPPLQERLRIAFRAMGLDVSVERLKDAFRAGEIYAVGQYLIGVPWDDPEALAEAVTRILQAMEMPLTDTAPLLKNFLNIPFERCVHPDASTLLADLKARGFILGAISDWEVTLPKLLKEWGISPYLDALAVSEIVGVTKPNVLLFEDALQQVSVAPENALHIGDWYELDVAGARTAGMQTLLFDWAGRRPYADCPRVTTFEELSAYLFEHAPVG